MIEYIGYQDVTEVILFCEECGKKTKHEEVSGWHQGDRYIDWYCLECPKKSTIQ